MKALTGLALLVVLITSSTYADAKKQEWYGRWTMNHDGHRGSLQITDSKVDCASTAWCDMVVHYRRADGVTYKATIARIDDRMQHIIFYIDFPGNRQKFDGYLFSWDKRSLAGTTYWGGRTFGFFATK